jgi:hypothetical protein
MAHLYSDTYIILIASGNYTEQVYFFLECPNNVINTTR